MIHRRTKIITFERQLWPQPPWNSSPYWWGFDDLSFYDRQHKEVWHQHIPESRELWNCTPEKKHVICMSVKRMARWGWVLTFQMTHDEADKIWPVKIQKEQETPIYRNDEGGAVVKTTKGTHGDLNRIQRETHPSPPPVMEAGCRPKDLCTGG